MKTLYNTKISVDLIRKLIAWYEETIKLITNSPRDCQSILRDRKTYMGICNCAYEVFNQDIYNDSWIRLMTPSDRSIFWMPTPDGIGADLVNVIERLQGRIDIMKKFPGL